MKPERMKPLTEKTQKLLLIFSSSGKPPVKAAKSCPIQDFGSGVYFFNCVDSFGEALVKFRHDHYVFSFTSFASPGTTGYWVMTQDIGQ
jgi:hypothetical protein